MLKESEMTENNGGRMALLWRGDREARRGATPRSNRYHRVFEELAALGIQAEPAVYDAHDSPHFQLPFYRARPTGTLPDATYCS
jgi:hypothetical protein